MTVKDPPRLLDAGAPMPNALRDGLAAARGDVPRGDQLARLAGRLPMGGAPPPGGNRAPPQPGSGASPNGAPGGGAPAPSLAPVTSILPAAGIGAFLAIATLGVHALLTRPEPPSIPARAPVVAMAVAPRAAVAGGGTESDDGDRARPEAPPRKAVVTSLSPAVGTAAASAGVDPAPSGGDSALAAADTRETEIELLQRAQDALRGAPSRALELTSRHAARFPGGTLGQESEVIAIDALVRLGRVGEARSRAAAFAARFPTSAHLPRIDALVHPSAGSPSSTSRAGEIDGEPHKGSTSAPPTP